MSSLASISTNKRIATGNVATAPAVVVATFRKRVASSGSPLAQLTSALTPVARGSEDERNGRTAPIPLNRSDRPIHRSLSRSYEMSHEQFKALSKAVVERGDDAPTTVKVLVDTLSGGSKTTREAVMAALDELEKVKRETGSLRGYQADHNDRTAN